MSYIGLVFKPSLNMASGSVPHAVYFTASFRGDGREKKKKTGRNALVRL